MLAALNHVYPYAHSKHVQRKGSPDVYELSTSIRRQKELNDDGKYSSHPFHPPIWPESVSRPLRTFRKLPCSTCHDRSCTARPQPVHDGPIHQIDKIALLRLKQVSLSAVQVAALPHSMASTRYRIRLFEISCNRH